MRVVLREVDVVFAQRVADEVVLEQDAAQVGMAAEDDPDHVPRLALVPVGRRPDAGDAVDLRPGARQLDVETMYNAERFRPRYEAKLNAPLLLGRAVTEPDGSFRADFGVPATMNLAAYDIWLSSPEDAYVNAARSEQ